MTLTMSKPSRPPACSEQELVSATRAGNDRAFEELYARYRERIFAFILSKVKDHGRAEDIAQDVFMSALRRLRRSDQEIAFKPWIYEIAKNACIDEYRRGSRAREVPLESDGEFVVDRQASLSAVPTPPAAVESKQRLEDLRGAFGGLSASQHQLLVMREFEGLSYDEIGHRLGMTRQMVESGLFRARRKLTEEYEELASGQRCEQLQTAIETGRMQSVRSLGLRDRRRFSRHLAHCQPCRHAALMAGVDEAFLKPRSIAAKIAALLPFPLWRLPWRSRGGKAAASASGSHHAAGAGAAGLVQSAGSAVTLTQAAAAVAALAIAGAGGTVAHGLLSGGPSHHPAAVRAANHGHGGSATSGGTRSGSPGASQAGHARAATLATGSTATGLAASRPAGSGAGQPRRQGRGSSSGAPGGPGAAKGGNGPGSATSASTGGGSHSTGSGPVNGVTKTLGSTASGVVHDATHPVQTVTKVVKGVNGVVRSLPSTVKTVVGSVPSPVKTVTDPVQKVVSTATGSVPSPVKTVTDPVQKVVSGVTGTPTPTTPSPTSTPTSGGSGSNPLAPITSKVSGTTSTVMSPVKSTVSQATDLLSH